MSSAEGSPAPKKKAAAAKIKVKSVDIKGEIEKDIAPPPEELEKIKERAIKKVTKKVKEEGKEIIRDIANQAAKKARDRFDHEQAPELHSFMPASTKAVAEPEELVSKVFNLPPPPPPSRDELKAVKPPGDEVVYTVMTCEELEHHSLKMWAMGVVTGMAVYYIGSKLCKMVFGSSAPARLVAPDSKSLLVLSDADE